MSVCFAMVLLYDERLSSRAIFACLLGGLHLLAYMSKCHISLTAVNHMCDLRLLVASSSFACVYACLTHVFKWDIGII